MLWALILPGARAHTHKHTHTHTHSLSLFLSVFLSISQSVIMEPSSPKKIQFAVPPLQGQLDPQAAEHVSVSEWGGPCGFMHVRAEWGFYL